ncbi:MAG: hypothetical protein EB068_00045 [Betaproteobacteria bacterium]|nr:hypothetical protein [Betaproteobacteria bacterium]
MACAFAHGIYGKPQILAIESADDGDVLFECLGEPANLCEQVGVAHQANHHSRGLGERLAQVL